MTDLELVRRAQAGDHAAFGELVDRHRVAVYRTAVAALLSDAEADDLAQDACVLAFRRLSSFRGDSTFRTWLLAITWNQALKRRRRFLRWIAKLVPLESLSDHRRGSRYAADASALSVISPWSSPHAQSPEHAAIEQERVHAVRRLVLALPVRLRDPLLLIASAEYDYKEMSEMLQTPAGTLKWRVAEARRQIKAKLERLGH